MRKNSLWIVLFLITGALLVACDVTVKAGYFEKDRASALARVEEFRRLYNAQNYAELYELGAPAMKVAVTREQFIASAQASLAQYGKYKSSVLAATSCFPNEVRLVYHSEYEKGKVTEWMAWSVPKDVALLVLYRVSPGYDQIKNESQKNCPS